MINKNDLLSHRIIYETQKRIEKILSVANIVLIITLGIVITAIINLFPLEEKRTKNILFSKISDSTFRVIPPDKIKNDITNEILKNYIYYRETFPNDQKELLKFFETPNVFEKRITFDSNFKGAIYNFDNFRRSIKFHSINFLSKNSLKAQIELGDQILKNKQTTAKKQLYTVAMKFSYQKQKTNDRYKYINPLGLKIIKYEIKSK